MPNRTLIVSMLLPAYLLLVLHSVIPHHHHAPVLNGPVQYHHGSHVHHTHDDHSDHDDPNDSRDHGPTSHFVHSPEFGNAMIRPAANWMEIQIPFHVDGHVASGERKGVEEPDLRSPLRPPEYSIFCMESVQVAMTLRGPPVGIG